MALSEHVNIVCSGADYRLAHDTAKDKIEQYATCSLASGGQDSVELQVSDSAPTDNWCLGEFNFPGNQYEVRWLVEIFSSLAKSYIVFFHYITLKFQLYQK